jgi:hypothetical protein
MNLILKMTIAGETFPAARIQKMKGGFWFTFLPHDGQTVLPIKLRGRHRKEAIEDGKAIVRILEQGVARMSVEEMIQTKEQVDAWLKTFVSGN